MSDSPGSCQSAPDPLAGARLKVERARYHLGVLGDEIRAWMESTPFRVVAEDEPKTGHSVIRVRMAEPGASPPWRLALIAGDAIHNLRTAADHLAVRLAEVGSGATSRTQFPIFDDEVEYDLWEARLLGGVAPTHRSQIRELQPFHVRHRVGPGLMLEPSDPLRRNVSLMIVGRLDNVDKHRVLLPSTGVAPFRKPQFEGVTRAAGTYPSDWVRMVEGAELFRVTSYDLEPGANTVTLKNAPVFTLLFGDPEFDLAALWSDRSKGTASRADLLLAADDLQAIIDSFAPAFA